MDLIENSVGRVFERQAETGWPVAADSFGMGQNVLPGIQHVVPNGQVVVFGDVIIQFYQQLIV